MPQVGSTVRVTTRYRNYFYLTAEKEPWEDKTYEGVVLPSMKWDEPYTFNITGDKSFPERNIALRAVVKMKILKGSAKQTNVEVRAFKVVSKSSGKTYTVVKNGTKYTCDCVGFQYRKHCKHVDGVHKKVG